LNCFSISRSLRSEEDDPIHEHLIPENRDFERDVGKRRITCRKMTGVGIKELLNPFYQ